MVVQKLLLWTLQGFPMPVASRHTVPAHDIIYNHEKEEVFIQLLYIPFVPFTYINWTLRDKSKSPYSSADKKCSHRNTEIRHNKWILEGRTNSAMKNNDSTFNQQFKIASWLSVAKIPCDRFHASYSDFSRTLKAPSLVKTPFGSKFY